MRQGEGALELSLAQVAFGPLHRGELVETPQDRLQERMVIALSVPYIAGHPLRLARCRRRISRAFTCFSPLHRGAFVETDPI